MALREGGSLPQNDRRPRSGRVSDRKTDPEIISKDHIPTVNRSYKLGVDRFPPQPCCQSPTCRLACAVARTRPRPRQLSGPASAALRSFLFPPGKRTPPAVPHRLAVLSISRGPAPAEEALKKTDPKDGRKAHGRKHTFASTQRISLPTPAGYLPFLFFRAPQNKLTKTKYSSPRALAADDAPTHWQQRRGNVISDEGRDDSPLLLRGGRRRRWEKREERGRGPERDAVPPAPGSLHPQSFPFCRGQLPAAATTPALFLL
jgi:hypothetical protein